MSPRRWSLDLLIQGYPGTTRCHGALGWSTVAMLRSADEVVLVDTGGYMQRDLLTARLAEHGVQRDQVTAVLLTHCHSDHMLNWPLFPRARVFVSGAELDWALAQPIGFWFIPEFHVAELADRGGVERVTDGDEIFAGVRVLATPGHTPGHVAYVAATGSGPVVFSGDAAKNLAELATGAVDMTLDAAASARSAARLRSLAADDDATRVVCGHDRVLSVVDNAVVARTSLRAAVVATFTADPAADTVFDLTPP